MVEKRSTDKRDDPKQSERFEKTARDVEAVDDDKALEKALKAIAEQSRKRHSSSK